MNRTDIINAIAAEINAESYLEIGVRRPADNFDKINVERKVGVDMASRDPRIIQLHSDAFFDKAEPGYDIVFIDGDHSHDQSQADFKNALRVLNKGGRIVLHDCLPVNADEALPEKPRNGKAWCGEVWKTWRYIRGRRDLTSICYDCDHGVGVVWRKRSLSVATTDADTWANAERWAGVEEVG